MEKCFASTQYSTERYRPRFEITTAPTASIDDGIYYVRSGVTENPYLTSVENCRNDTNVYRQGKISEDPSLGMNQLWRITHAGNGYYTLRPYHYTPAGLVSYIPGGGTVYDENAVIHHLGYVDTMDGANSTGLWRIVPLADGTYYLNLFGSNAYLGSSSASDTNVRACDNYGNAEHKWTFEVVTDPPRTVVFYNATTGVKENMPVRELYSGESKSFASLNLSVSISVPNDNSLSPNACTWSPSERCVTIGESSSLVVQICATGIGRSVITVSGNSILPEEVLYIQSYQSGYYYFRNKSSQKYIDIENKTAGEGSIIHQWQFSGGLNTRWKVTFYNGKKCVIQSAKNEDYYLVLQDSGEIVLSSNGNANRNWEIDITSNGYCRIIPETNETQAVAISLSESGSVLDNGLRLVGISYTDDSDLSDEWTVVDSPYHKTVYHLYDEAFAANYSGKIPYISAWQNDVNTVFYDVFGLKLEYEVLSFISVSDSCKNIVDGTCTVPHIYTNSKGIVCSFLCTDPEAVSNYYQQIYSPSDIYIFWHGNESYNFYGARSFSFGQTIFVLNGGDDCRELLSHEIAHQFGAPDHYCEVVDGVCKNAVYCNNMNHVPSGGNKIEMRGGSCFMDHDGHGNITGKDEVIPSISFDNRLATENYFCEGCRVDIFEYLYMHVYG